MKKCLIVLGMHRSGTSAFTGVLDIMGINLGTKMLETQPDNPKGFFENKYVVLANDCILDTLNSSWDDTLPLPHNWPDRFKDSQLIVDMRAFLRTDITENHLSALKDPRLSKLLPLWLPLFAAEGVSPHFALIIRNPLEIAHSLSQRNGFSIEKSLTLWMQYMADAERYSRQLPRGFLKFESLLSDPRGSLERLFAAVGLELPVSSHERLDELALFLDRNMRHHQVSDQELETQCFKVVADYYRLLCKIADQELATPDDLLELDELYRTFEVNRSFFNNSDMLASRTLAGEKWTPAWYEADLKRIKQQFESDRIFREYRYIAHTEYLYKVQTVEVPQLRLAIDDLHLHLKARDMQVKDRESQIKDRELQIEDRELQIEDRELQIADRESQIRNRDVRIDELDHEINQMLISLPWRVYLKYQSIVEQLLPEGTLRRKALQKFKRLISASAANEESPAVLSVHSPSDASDEKSSAIPSSRTPSDANESSPALQPMGEVDSPQNQPIDAEASITQALQPAATASADPPPSESLVFPASESPAVSIIIPVFNNWQLTYACLQSILQHTGSSYEVIVVDNNSTDVTPQLLADMQGICVITNETNEVFVNACNHAAKGARGDYLLFLNNDTEVSPGWLDAMLAPFADSSTGVVGAKLVYPDGSLQEAGGIIWRDGTGCNYGHGDDPDLPQYSYRRAVDYCSGACLMISRRLWEAIGGFDQRYAPAYYEDTDLCFAARALNYKVVYQPAARVVHFGGASAGKETSSGYKRYQEVNRHKFVDKWQDVLERDHVPSSAGLFKARERTGSQHILIIDHHAPTFDRDSGSLRMLNMVQILRDMNYKVSFWPDDLTYDPRYTKALQDHGVETYYGDLNFEDYIREQGDHLDIVLMSRPVTAKKYLLLVKKYSRARTIFDTVDLHFVREQRRLELEVQQWKNLEFFLAQETDNTFVVSPKEREILAAEPFADKIAVVSNIHSLEPCTNGFEERHGLLFIGGFAHPPNEEGILWFIDFILPIVRRKIPDIHLTIVGSDPTERLKALASSTITVTGYVEDVSSLFNDSRVFVSPLLHGAGIKGKIGQSFSYGLPVVTTSIGAEGMRLTDGHNALISDSETVFASKVIELYTDKFVWHKISTNSRQVIREQFSPATIRAALEKVLGTHSRTIADSPRPVIVHCHLFKNAGMTLDWSLKRQFGARFMQHWDDASMRQGASYLGPYIKEHPELSAISSHHVRLPLPVSEEFHALPIIAVRHPFDRARSAYNFERRQEATTPGAMQAKKLSFAEYVRWRMQPDVGPTIRNFHCSFFTGTANREIGEKEFLDSVALLSQTPMLVIVERYDESMLLLENYLAPYFPAIDLSYILQNETPDREGSLPQRIDAMFEELGPDLALEFQQKNHWDMKLYENARAILAERLGSLGHIDRLLENFRSRCRLLLANRDNL